MTYTFLIVGNDSSWHKYEHAAAMLGWRYRYSASEGPDIDCQMRWWTAGPITLGPGVAATQLQTEAWSITTAAQVAWQARVITLLQTKQHGGVGLWAALVITLDLHIMCSSTSCMHGVSIICLRA